MLASILVVDPDQAIHGRMAHELRELGHGVAESEDAFTALEPVRRKRPDPWLYDLALPDLGGVDLVNDVRSIDDLGTMHVVVMLSHDIHNTPLQRAFSGTRNRGASPALERIG
jgi:CheY-like chemotaxis protein